MNVATIIDKLQTKVYDIAIAARQWDNLSRFLAARAVTQFENQLAHSATARALAYDDALVALDATLFVYDRGRL